MALFPAYAEADNLEDDNNTLNGAEIKPLSYEVSEAMEVQLLASDTEEELTASIESSKGPLQSKELSSEDFYLDRKLDCGNLRVSTLYYPGRPQYSYVKVFTVGAKRNKKDEDSRWRRYFSKRLTEEPDTSAHERLIAYRKLLAETPDDIQIWEAYIDFQEVCGTIEGALDAARAAVVQLPECSRLRDRLYCLLQAVLSHRQYLEEIRNMLAKERRASVRTELWARLVRGAGAGAATGADTDVLRAALADTAHHAPAAPALIHAFGSYLRTAGLWERLVLAVELLVAMNLPAPRDPRAACAFPPPADPAAVQRAERRLLELEDKAIGSGLPRHAVWARVERARAGAHWRPAPDARDALDPQRAPLPHDVADLLLPLVGVGRLLHLATRLLLLAKVPMVPATDHLARTLGEADGCAEELLPLAYAHRLVAGGPPAGTARLLELLTDPPHYFSDDTGFSSWVSALWEACGAALRAAGAGAAAEALLCWRLRWLHARLLLCAGPQARSEAARLRNEARGLLKRLAQSSPLAFAEFARLELSAWRAAGGAGGAEGGPERALAAATHALRAAIADADRPTSDALYIARVVGEVSEAAGAGALVCAALRRPPPAALAPPAAALRDAALLTCEERCSALEAEAEAAGVVGAAGAEGAEDGGVLAALRPGAAEWARARAALAGPARREQLLRQLLHRQGQAVGGPGGARYDEEGACELVRRGGARLAPVLARLYPGNAYLNLVSAYTPAWRGAALGAERRVSALAAPRAPAAALARLLPALARAAERDWEPAEAERAVRAARRATSGAAAGGVALRAARVECEARARAPRLPHALLAALHLAPHDKWLHVRGAAWCGGEAAALADALLEKQLRLHALPDELAPLPPTSPTPPPPPTAADALPRSRT